MKWGLSPLDWCSHAIDERRDHPLGVLKAECGHLLMMVTTLRDRPFGAPCEACAAKQFTRAAKVDHEQISAGGGALDGLRMPAPRFGDT